MFIEVMLEIVAFHYWSTTNGEKQWRFTQPEKVKLEGYTECLNEWEALGKGGSCEAGFGHYNMAEATPDQTQDQFSSPSHHNLISLKPPQASRVSPLPISPITAQSSTHGSTSQSKYPAPITPELVHGTSLNSRSQSCALPSCRDSLSPIRHLLFHYCRSPTHGIATPPPPSYSRCNPLPPLSASRRAPITTMRSQPSHLNREL
ncbi:hypothetical protein M0R45_027169 [Rubus argutus]|uniref:Uncharacterized protein n=1 Tax=Rubus argutus TaxID=59490 RepID=A0AAW1X022_RUBAR